MSVAINELVFVQENEQPKKHRRTGIRESGRLACATKGAVFVNTRRTSRGPGGRHDLLTGTTRACLLQLTRKRGAGATSRGGNVSAPGHLAEPNRPDASLQRRAPRAPPPPGPARYRQGEPPSGLCGGRTVRQPHRGACPRGGPGAGFPPPSGPPAGRGVRAGQEAAPGGRGRRAERVQGGNAGDERRQAAGRRVRVDARRPAEGGRGGGSAPVRPALARPPAQRTSLAPPPSAGRPITAPRT